LKLDVNHEEIEALNELVNPDSSTDKISYESKFLFLINYRVLWTLCKVLIGKRERKQNVKRSF
jgi:hypothetical protein